MPTAANVGADPTGTASSAVAAHVAAGDPHTQYLTQARGDARYQLNPEVAVGLVAPTNPATLLWIDEGSNYP
jgi:hypothetical protein